MNILSIQSQVSYGHVGNSAAVFAMQRLGAEVWPVNTVAFSNHPGHGGLSGRVIDSTEIEALIDGIAKLGVLSRCDAVISGYLGATETGPIVLKAVAKAREANPRLLYCCDPVIGDVGPGLYVRKGLPEFMRDEAMPAADMVTPNQFELEYLSGQRVSTQGELKSALAYLRERGPRVALVTSVITAETPPDAIDIAASGGCEAWLLRTPRLGRDFNGAGDAMAALFLVNMLRSGSVPEALAAAAASVFGILERTAAGASRELLLIEAQDEIVAPSRRFPVESLGALA